MKTWEFVEMTAFSSSWQCELVARSSMIWFRVTGYYVLGIQETSCLIIQGFRILRESPKPGVDNPVIRPPVSHDRQCTYNVVIEARSYNHFCNGKAMRITQPVVCTCSLRYLAYNTHAPYGHVACPTLRYFATLAHKWHDFREKKVTGHKMCFDFLHNLCLKQFSF